METAGVRRGSRPYAAHHRLHYLHDAPAPDYRFNYGIDVTDVSPDRTEVVVRLTFLPGRRYSAEPGCHHGLPLDTDFERLRECFRRAGVEVGGPMRVRLRVVCRAGALVARDPGKADPHYEPIAVGWECDEAYDEAAAYQGKGTTES